MQYQLLHPAFFVFFFKYLGLLTVNFVVETKGIEEKRIVVALNKKDSLLMCKLFRIQLRLLEHLFHHLLILLLLLDPPLLLHLLLQLPPFHLSFVFSGNSLIGEGGGAGSGPQVVRWRRSIMGCLSQYLL